MQTFMTPLRCPLLGFVSYSIQNRAIRVSGSSTHTICLSVCFYSQTKIYTYLSVNVYVCTFAEIQRMQEAT